MASDVLDSLPYGLVYIFTVVFLLAALEIGYRLGRLVQKYRPDKSEPGVGVIVGAALALLGFLLTFVTTLSVDIFNQRRHLVVEEANAIGTVYLQAGLLSEANVATSRELLREYIDLRVATLEQSKWDEAVERSEEIQIELWRMGATEARATPVPTMTMYLTSLGHLIDIHTERVNAELGFRVPRSIIFGLYGVALLTMALVGIHDSYAEKRNLLALILVTLILSVIFILIIDLDRSYVGIIRIPGDALLELQRVIGAR